MSIDWSKLRSAADIENERVLATYIEWKREREDRVGRQHSRHGVGADPEDRLPPCRRRTDPHLARRPPGLIPR